MKRLLYILIVFWGAAAHSVTCALYDSLANISAPYPYSLRSPSGQLLEYIGTRHTSNASHSQYALINTRWKKFLELSKEKNKLITIVEAAQPGSYSSQEHALQEQTDCGYATWLAAQNNVPVIGAELTKTSIIQQLIQEFGTQDATYFAFAQALSFGFQRQLSGLSLEDYVVQYVRKWTGNSTLTFEQLKAVHKKFAGFEFKSDPQFFFKLTDLTYHNSFFYSTINCWHIPKLMANKFYRILRRSHQIRDEHTLQVITNQWNQGNNIFVVYGAVHAAALKQELKKLTNH